MTPAVANARARRRGFDKMMRRRWPGLDNHPGMLDSRGDT
jgi:hypothetical protein